MGLLPLPPKPQNKQLHCFVWPVNHNNSAFPLRTIHLWGFFLASNGVRCSISPASSCRGSNADVRCNDDSSHRILRTPSGPESAKQLLGIYDNSDAADADAVYFAAHDPERVVKTCNLDKQSFGCTMLALNATLPLHTYVAAFPIVITVIPQHDPII